MTTAVRMAFGAIMALLTVALRRASGPRLWLCAARGSPVAV